MSVLSPKRAILFAVASLLGTALYANHPSPRLYPAMAFDERAGGGVLFGGRGLEEAATALTHASDQTWMWVSNQWAQQFPEHRPPARSAHTMTYDSTRGRVLLFGGRKEATVTRTLWSFYNDTWAWQNGQWQQIETAAAPSARELPAMTYDRDHDRVILFGGFDFAPDGQTAEPLFDTWEFDGQNWTEVSRSGPELSKPLIAFDQARHQVVLLGINEEFETLMYRWNRASSTWESVTPTTLPTCVNEAGLTYQAHNQRLVLAGGVCGAETSTSDETWEWDGENWTKLTTTDTPRFTGFAIAYDTVAQKVVRYGGLAAFGSAPDASTYLYRNLKWTFTAPTSSPSPRSLLAFRRDPVRNTLWLYGGLNEFSTAQSIFYNEDFWRYENGVWYQEGRATGRPIDCATPLSAFDTDRQVMVVVCGDARVFEWNGTEWKSFSGLSDKPNGRRFAGLVYDETLKKTVYFGGFDGANYRDDTWTWNGTNWTEVDVRNEPENRAQMAMWYDPLAKKTIIFSGVGRPNIDARVTRFEDMWSFDGTNWTKMNVTQTPGIRFGAQVAVDPRDGKVLLFGGLRATVQGKIVDQFYDDDLWTWDGAASRWTEIPTGLGPSPRQNGGFEFDPTTGKFTLFGGYAGGFYHSDVWLWDGENWSAVPDRVTSNRRRAARP